MILPLASGVFPSLAPSDRSAIWAVTGRLGGTSEGPFSGANLADHVGDTQEHVDSNRVSLAALVGVNQSDLAVMAPVHGGEVAFVDSAGVVDSVDSLVTEEAEIGLVALGADCATIGICGYRDNHQPIIAVAHCGWKGLCADVLGNTVKAMSERGAVTFRAILGPAICGNCYPVPKERIQQVRDRCRAHIAAAALGISGGIDVRAGLEAQLADLGIPCTSIGGCTAESSHEFFSYRRDGRTGRQGLILALKESINE